jgi:UDP-N-acetylmuramyl pentapeptide synthase
MRSVDAIARAKGELLDALPDEGVAVLNADDPRVMSQLGRTRSRVITFGLSREADVRASDVSEAPGTVRFTLAGHGDVTLPVPGRHNVANALAALAAASAVGIGLRAAARGLAAFESSPMRMDVSIAGRWTIVNDAYNSNPGSLSAALRALVSIGEGVETAAVLGDMLELGERSESAHREAGRQAAELGVDYLFLFGTEVGALREGALMGGMAPSRATVFESKAELVGAVRRALAGSAAVLVKGSRGMRMEEAVEMLTQEAPAT